MSRITNILIGVPTFGNFVFTKMCIEHIVKTTKRTKYKLMVVVGKPNDSETINYCLENNIYHIVHEVNKGLPASVNDIYDHAFMEKSYDAVVIVGNDVLPYWNSIDQLVDIANKTDYDWVSGVAVAINTLIKAVPDCAKYFGGGEKNKNFNETNLTEWLDKYKPIKKEKEILDLAHYGIVGDSHNMCLFTKELFNKIGYIDVNFFPAYYEDNDYSRRAQLAGIKMCRVTNSVYFHYWSRTLHQGGMKATNDKYFPMNKSYYIEKWGGEPGKETYTYPFNGGKYELGGISMKGHINIRKRSREEFILNAWRQK